MSLGNWLQQCRNEFQDDASRRRLLTLYDDAYGVREDDPQAALNRYREGKELADRLGEAWWGLFFDKLQLDARVHFLRDLRGVLEPAAACVREVRRPVYNRFPVRWGVYDTLIAAYLGIDAEGYHEAIHEALAELDGEIGPEPSPDRYLLLARRREFACAEERWEEAQDDGLRELDLAHADPHEAQGNHFAAFAYPALCAIAHQRRQWARLEEFCDEGEQVVRQAGHQAELAELLAWRAVSERYRDRREPASRTLREARDCHAALQLIPRPGFFAAQVAYHELGEQPADMLHALDDALAVLVDHNRLLEECRVRTQRLKILIRLDRSIEEDLEQAREAARRLRFPEPHLARIDAVEQGEESRSS